MKPFPRATTSSIFGVNKERDEGREEKDAARRVKMREDRKAAVNSESVC